MTRRREDSRLRTIGDMHLHYCDRHRLPKSVEKGLNFARALLHRRIAAAGTRRGVAPTHTSAVSPTLSRFPMARPDSAVSKRFLPSVHVLAGTLGGLRQFGTRPATGVGGGWLFLAVNLIRRKRRAAKKPRDKCAQRRCSLLRRGTVASSSIGRRRWSLSQFACPGRRWRRCSASPATTRCARYSGETRSLRLLVGYLRALDSEAALESSRTFVKPSPSTFAICSR